MTEISEIFQRDVSRPIDGVIRADDFESLQAELEEYVITNEIASNLSKFLTEYNNYTTSNGVWISGFFGSGKSHLLKLLSIVIDDKEVNNQSSAEIFVKKCEDQDSFLGAELKKAVAVPSKSILFNIDQKAAIISSNDVDKLLSVFEMLAEPLLAVFDILSPILQGIGQIVKYATAIGESFGGLGGIFMGLIPILSKAALIARSFAILGFNHL